MRIIRLLSAALAGATLLLVSVSADAANPRIALVIGESAYPDAALPTAANDAGLVAQVLQAAGFDVVGARDLDQKSIRESLRDFLDKANSAGPDMQAFVYFSGRALQYAGDNYLAPIDARIARDSDAPIEAIRLSDFTHALAAAPGLARVVVIDGARANPYAQQGQPLAGGLALVDPEPGSIIAFNAAPGSIGVEDAGDYGVYAKSLAGLMRQGGVDIAEILEQTRVEVNQKTQGAQLPWSAGKLSAPYFLFERAADAAPIKPRVAARKPLKQLSTEDAYAAVIARDRLSDYEEFLREHARSEQARRIEAIVAARREAMFWRRALDMNNPRAYWTYLRRYPRGPHAYDASRRLEILRAQLEPPPNFAAIEFEDLPPPPPREIVYADRPVYYFGGDDYGPPPPPPPRGYVYDERDEDWNDLPPPPPPTLAGVLPTLAIAIPLMIAARAYHDRPRRDGRAPPSAPPPPQRPIGPPPLPRGVQVQAAPTPAPARPPRAEKGPGQVKFAPPPTAAPGGRPPAPGVVAPRNGEPARPPLPGARTPLPAPGVTPAPGGKPAPVDGRTQPGPGGKPTPEGARTPLPAPGATPAPGGKPAPVDGRTQPGPGGKPAPVDGRTQPGPGGKPTPEGARTPLPAPAATPTPGGKPAPVDGRTQPGPGGKPTPDGARTPLPAPGATPAPGGKPAPVDGRTQPGPRGKPTPEGARTPLPAPGATPALDGKPAPVDGRTQPGPRGKPAPEGARTPAPRANPEPQKAKPAEAQKLAPRDEPAKAAPRAETPKPAPALREPAKAAPAPRAEPLKPAPAPRAEPPKPAPRAEPPRPAPAPRAEPPKPAPAPRAEPPKAAPRAEPPKPAPAPAGKAAACGHPGQPRC